MGRTGQTDLTFKLEYFQVTCVGQLSQFLRCLFFYQFSEEEEEEQTQVVPQGDITLLGFDQLANLVI